MANIERLIIGYHLVIESTVNNFNDIVNHLLEDGYQFMNDDGVRIENIDDSVYYKTEMVRYAPDLRTVQAGRPERRTMPADIAHEIANTQVNRTIERARLREEQIPIEENRRRVENLVRGDMRATPTEPMDDVVDDVLETVGEIPFPQATRNFWTADSPDPFDDEDEGDDDSYNEHQLRRMGMAEEPQTNDEIMEAPQMAEEDPQTQDGMPF